MLEFDQLAALTAALVAHPGWQGRTPIVACRVQPGVDGRLVGRRIVYSAAAPACVVFHELAHLASGDLGHGPAWSAWFVRLLGWVRVDGDVSDGVDNPNDRTTGATDE